MGLWKLVAPEATTNLAFNPSFETNTNSTAVVGTNTRSISTEQSKFGLYSMKCVTGNSQNIVRFITDTSEIVLPTTNTTYTVSAWIYVPTGWDGEGIFFEDESLTGASHTEVHRWDETTDPFDTWFYIESTITVATDVVGYFSITADTLPTAAQFIYVDGLQVEEKSYATTYCDGEQVGCEWTGTPHASTSTRNPRTYQGGRPLTLDDDLSIHVNGAVGIGMTRRNTNIPELGLSDGGFFQSTRARVRNWQLICQINGSSLQNLITLKETFLGHLDPTRLGRISEGDPVRFIYTGDTEDVYIDAVYTGGAEFSGRDGFTETIPVRLSSPYPYLRRVGESSASLSDETSVSFSYVVFRGKDGWDNMGPESGGTKLAVYALAAGADGLIYIGGNFTNWDGTGVNDYLVTFDPNTGNYAVVGSSGANNTVFALSAAADGTIYAGGDFTTINGVSATRAASWNGTTWSALGAGADNRIRVFKQGPDGHKYAGGDFTTAGGVTCRNIAYWNDIAWVALGPPSAAGNVYDLDWDPSGNLYVVGGFTNWDGIASADWIAKWDGSSWSAVTTAVFNGQINSITFDGSGNFYVGGSFTTYGGVSGYNGLAYFNGTTFVPLSTGVSGGTSTVRSIELDDAGQLWVSGNFTSAGGNDLCNRIAIWNGTSFDHLDIDLPGTPTFYGMLNHNERMYFGFDTSGSGSYAGETTVTNNGSSFVYPVIYIKREGGTSSRLQYIENQTTGKRLLIDYDLLDGETLTIDLRPGSRKMVSSANGERWAIKSVSDVAEFVLKPGSNVLSVLAVNAGSPTVTTWATWEETVIGVA